MHEEILKAFDECLVPADYQLEENKKRYESKELSSFVQSINISEKIIKRRINSDIEE